MRSRRFITSLRAWPVGRPQKRDHRFFEYRRQLPSESSLSPQADRPIRDSSADGRSSVVSSLGKSRSTAAICPFDDLVDKNQRLLTLGQGTIAKCQTIILVVTFDSLDRPQEPVAPLRADA
jgi:hypothetical protein